MPIERVEDRLHVRRAVGEVAVVVVGGQVHPVAAHRAAAAGALGALVPVREVVGGDRGESRGDLERGVEAVVRQAADALQVAGEQVIDRLGGDLPLAVGLPAARTELDAGNAGTASLRGRGRTGLCDGIAHLADPGDVVGLGAHVLAPVEVADAGAGGADAAAVVARAAVGEEPAPEAGVGQPQDAVDVRDGLSGRGDAGVGAIVVEAVAPLVVEDGGDLAGVPAPVARPIEVDAGAVPEGVAGGVDVHVRHQLVVHPRLRGVVFRQEVAPPLDLAVQLVEPGSGGVRVSRGVARRHRAVVAAARAEVEIGADRRLVGGAAPVGHPYVGAAQVGPRLAPDRHHAGAVGGQVRAEHVCERHRKVGLLDAVGSLAVVADRIDPARDLARVLVDVAEREKLTGLRVDQTLPRAVVAACGRPNRPSQPVSRAVSDRDLARVIPFFERNDFEPRRAGDRQRRSAGVSLHTLHRRLSGKDRHRRDRSGSPVLRAHQDDLSRVERHLEPAVADRDAVDEPWRMKLDDPPAVEHADARLTDLIGKDTELRLELRHVAEHGDPCRLLRHAARGDQRATHDEQAPAAAPDVVIPGLPAERGEIRARLRGQSGRQLRDRPSLLANVEIRMSVGLRRERRVSFRSDDAPSGQGWKQ